VPSVDIELDMLYRVIDHVTGGRQRSVIVSLLDRGTVSFRGVVDHVELEPFAPLVEWASGLRILMVASGGTGIFFQLAICTPFFSFEPIDEGEQPNQTGAGAPDCGRDQEPIAHLISSPFVTIKNSLLRSMCDYALRFFTNIWPSH